MKKDGITIIRSAKQHNTSSNAWGIHKEAACVRQFRGLADQQIECASNDNNASSKYRPVCSLLEMIHNFWAGWYIPKSGQSDAYSKVPWVIFYLGARHSVAHPRVQQSGPSSHAIFVHLRGCSVSMPYFRDSKLFAVPVVLALNASESFAFSVRKLSVVRVGDILPFVSQINPMIPNKIYFFFEVLRSVLTAISGARRSRRYRGCTRVPARR